MKRKQKLVKKVKLKVKNKVKAKQKLVVKNKVSVAPQSGGASSSASSSAPAVIIHHAAPVSQGLPLHAAPVSQGLPLHATGAVRDGPSNDFLAAQIKGLRDEITRLKEPRSTFVKVERAPSPAGPPIKPPRAPIRLVREVTQPPRCKFLPWGESTSPNHTPITRKRFRPLPQLAL